MKIGDIDLGQQPLFLAPMEDVTDPSFRYMCKRFGADVVTTEFSTTKPVASENSFEIEINAVISTGVKFTITPTHNDPYFVTIQDKRYVERFGEGKEESLEDMIWDLTFNKTDQQISNYIFSATQELTNDSIAKIVDTLHEYHIVVFGFKDGPTTEVYISEVFQPTEL